MLIFLGFFIFLFLALTILVALRQAPGYHRRQDEQTRLAIELSQPYRQKIEEDRQYSLAVENQRLERDRFTHEAQTDIAKLWLDTHILPAEKYVVNAEVTSLTALPSLKRDTVNLVQPPEPEPVALPLPGECDLLTLLDGWQPRLSSIMLALGPGEERITVPMKGLCHVALAGATGLGKSTLMRLLLSQLLFAGCKVVLADPHFAPVDPENGEDWRPIARRLAAEPAVSYPAIKEMLSWLAYDELPKRKVLRNQGQPVGDPCFLALDELPSIRANVKESVEAMDALLREGRKFNLFMVSAAQDWLVKTIGGTGAVRDCFRTAFYVGGDTTSARVLLDVSGKVDDGRLGKGVVMLRSAATPQASLARVPYVSNEALYELLPVSSSASTAASTISTVEAGIETNLKPVEAALDVRSLRIRDMLKSGTSQRQIIQEVWGVSSGGAYTKAASELSQIIVTLL